MKGTSPLPQHQHKYRNLSLRRHIQKKKPYQFPCNINEFQFNLPIPNYSLPITLRATQSDPFSNQTPKAHTNISQQEQRREQIKQKIKFRVKQEMWSYIKKDLQKPSTADYVPYVSDFKRQSNSFFIKETDLQRQAVYVRGAASFVHISKENTNARNKSERSSRKCLSKSYFKENVKQKEDETNSKVKHKRVWSSFVKMKERDRKVLQRTEKKASFSVINLQKLDGFKIEPWKAFEDQQNPIDQH